MIRPTPNERLRVNDHHGCARLTVADEQPRIFLAFRGQDDPIILEGCALKCSKHTSFVSDQTCPLGHPIHRAKRFTTEATRFKGCNEPLECLSPDGLASAYSKLPAPEVELGTLFWRDGVRTKVEGEVCCGT